MRTVDERGAMLPIDLPARASGGRFVGEGVVLVVTRDGTSHVVDLDSGVVSAETNIGFEPQRSRPVGRDSLFVEGESASVLLDSDGSVVREWEAVDDTAVTVYSSGSECMVVQPGRVPRPGTHGELIEISSGETVVELADPAESLSSDGCSVMTSFVDTTELVVGRSMVDIDGARVVAIDSDLARAVVSRANASGVVVALRDLRTGAEFELPQAAYTFT